MLKHFSLYSKAIYYEFLGKKDEALGVHANILKQDPSHEKSKISIRRLSGVHMKFSNVNDAMLDKFKNMNNEQEFLEFEKWLLKIQK